MFYSHVHYVLHKGVELLYKNNYKKYWFFKKSYEASARENKTKNVTLR